MNVKGAFCTLTFVRCTVRILRWWIKTLPRATVIMTDASLYFLSPCMGGFISVRDNIGENDTVDADHLFVIDVACPVAIDVVQCQTIIGTIRVGLE